MDELKRLETVVVDDLLITLRCFFCNKYLTVPPICTNEARTKYRCGRCKQIQCEMEHVCRLPGNIAKKLKVPCDYDGCQKLLMWAEVEQHERVCPHRTMSCPLYFSKSCKTKIKCEELVDHMTRHHTLNLIQEIMEFELRPNFNYVNVLILKGLPFLFFSNAKNVFVTSIKPDTHFTYNLKIYKNENTCSFSYERQTINDGYNEILNCCACLAKKCQESNHPYSSRYATVNESLHKTVIDIEMLKVIFGADSKLKCTIQILPIIREKNTKDVWLPAAKVLDMFKTNNAALRKTFECPICSQIMVRPIFTCDTGHSMCCHCKEFSKTCPTCSSVMGSVRNYSLEILGESLKMSCSKKEEECKFVGNNMVELSIHEKECMDQ